MARFPGHCFVGDLELQAVDRYDALGDLGLSHGTKHQERRLGTELYKQSQVREGVRLCLVRGFVFVSLFRVGALAMSALNKTTTAGTN